MRLVGVAVLVALCVSGCVVRSGSPVAAGASAAAPVASETGDWEEVVDDDWAVSFAMPAPVDGAVVAYPDEVGTPLDGYSSTPAPGLLMEVVASGVTGGDITEEELRGLAQWVPYSLGAEGGTVSVLNSDTVDGRPTVDAKIVYMLSGDVIVRMERLIGDGDWLYLLSTSGPSVEAATITEFQAGLVGTLEFD